MSARGYAVAVLLVLLVVGVSFHWGQKDFANDYRTLKPELLQLDGGAGPLSAREYVDLQLDIYAQREVMQLRFAAILVALLCVSAGVGVLLASASDSSSAMTVERTTTVRLPPDDATGAARGTLEETETTPTLGPPAVGLLLIVIGGLVVLLAPRDPVLREERARAFEAQREAVDAGTPPAQPQGIDAGVPAH